MSDGMKVVVVGAGYVGLTTGSVLADFGHSVTCVESNQEKLRLLSSGSVPIHEPGLDELVKKNVEEGRLSFSGSLSAALADCDVAMIAVGTPSLPDGSADLSSVWSVVDQIASSATRELLVVMKSTVPVGTTDEVARRLNAAVSQDQGLTGGVATPGMGQGTAPRFHVASCPEFLREGKALIDLVHPDRIVVGCDSNRAAQLLRQLFAPIDAPVLIVDRRSAEMIKYASNAFLATKISFINEVATLCELLGADVHAVAQGMGLDSRIGQKFLQAGVGYGGSCFPKDTRALLHMAKQAGYDFRIVRSTIEVNERLPLRVIEKLEGFLGSLSGRRIALLGLAFKPETDDVREAPAIFVSRHLLERGASVVGYDPVASGTFHAEVPRVEIAANAHQALQDADALVLMTEWDEFRSLDLEEARRLMKTPIMVDGRNLFDPSAARKAGFRYTGFGRGADRDKEGR